MNQTADNQHAPRARNRGLSILAITTVTAVTVSLGVIGIAAFRAAPGAAPGVAMEQALGEAVVATSVGHAAAAASAGFIIVPTEAELEDALRRVSLDPASLTAAGLSDADVDTVVDNVRTHLTNNPGDIETADGDFADAKRDCDALERIVVSGLGSAQDATDFQTAVSTYNTEASDRLVVLDAVFDAGVADLTTGEVATLSQVRDNRALAVVAQDEMRVSYLVVSRSEADWCELRDALANERIASALGESTDSADQTVIDDADSDSDVSTAHTNLDSNLTSRTTAWSDAITGV